MFSRRGSQSGAEGASLVARAAWAFVTPALVLLIYVLGKPARGVARGAQCAAALAQACFATRPAA